MLNSLHAKSCTVDEKLSELILVIFVGLFLSSHLFLNALRSFLSNFEKCQQIYLLVADPFILKSSLSDILLSPETIYGGRRQKFLWASAN